MLNKLKGPQFTLGLSLIILFGLCLYPFLILIAKVLFPAGDFSAEFFMKAFHSKSTLLAMKNTIVVSTLTAFISLCLALPLAFLLSRTDLKNKKKWRTLFCLPYAIPPYIGAIAWIILGNPKMGLLNLIAGESWLNIYSMGGLIWVMSSFFYTYILLSLLTAFDRMDPSLEEAARLSGAGPFKVFLDITLPISLPSLFSGLLLVFLASAASFGVPAMIGNPAQIYLMTTKIYTFQKMGSMSGIFVAGALSIILLVLSLIVLFSNQRLLKNKKFQVVSGKSARPSFLKLNQYKWPVIILLCLFFFLVFVLPVLGIAFSAFSKVQGTLSFSNFGFQNFFKIFFEMNETPRALFNSFSLAFWAATIATTLGLFLSYINVKTRIKGKGLIETFASLPYASPGTVAALAFILAYSRISVFGYSLSLYNTLPFIILAYIAKYLNFGVRTTGDGLSQIDDVLAEAARVSGADWFTTLRTVWFPLMKPALVASWFLIFMPAFSELTMTILLSGPGTETLGTLIFQLQEYGDASGGGAAVLALFTIGFVALINFIVKFISKGKYGL
ncbi:iron ABC transporter permease [Bacteriovoracaceae bacterium]|nr:iron ABC transporter permease [Bacteriovoracaceae bacterium]|tara:strand:+ start:416742 stop:418412 length:1671 start_codon:yes stop_codon:yes gene_type:complete